MISKRQRYQLIVGSVLVFAFYLFVVPRGTAQEITGTILGAVTDNTGATVPGANVTVRNVGTNVKRSYSTNETGLYLFPFLPPGDYELTVEAKGFERFLHSNMVLDVNQKLRVDVTLTLGPTTQSVTVTGAPPVLETASGSLGQTINSRALAELPSLNRNPLNIVFLSPGIAPSVFDRESTTAAATMSSINGGRPDDNEVLIDGGSTVSPSSVIAVLNPSVDAVDEVRIEANSYSAQFGRAVGGTVNITTKSGTNQIHGTAFEFNRVAALSARNFFDVQRPRLTRNQFGGVIGGPVYIPRIYNGRDRTFFFFSYEGIRHILGLTNIGTVPTAAMRSGDFSGLAPIYDPATTTVVNGTQVRSAFAGNQILPTRFDAVANKIMQFYPLPNRPGTVNNFVLSLPTTNIEDRVDGRIDQNFGAKNKLFGRFLWDNPRNSTTNNAPRTLPDVRVDPSLPQQPVPQQWVLGDTDVLSARTLNDFRFTFFRFFSTQYPGSINKGFPAQLGLNGVSQELFPYVAMTGILPIGALNINDTRQNVFSWSDTVSHTRGIHSLKAGFSLSRFQFNNRSQGAVSSNSSFDVLPTAQIGQSKTTGNQVASFLLGYPTNSSLASYNPTFGYRWANYATFIQDDIRVSSRFTLNVGMRYEIETPMTEEYNRMSNFDLQTGGLVYAGANGEPRALSRTDYHNFGPRFGFAWTPRQNGRVVLRGGYGIFYADTSSSQVQTSRSTGFTELATFSSPDNGVTLPIKLDQGFPPIPPINPTSIATAKNVSTNVIEPNTRRAQVQQWNFNVQRQFGNYLVETAYAGSKGTHLVATSYNLNQVPAALLGPGNAQPERPYPEFQNIIVNNPNAATSIYNSFYVSVNRRLSTGLTLIP